MLLQEYPLELRPSVGDQELNSWYSGEPVRFPHAFLLTNSSNMREIKSLVWLGLLMASGKPLNLWISRIWGQDTWVNMLQSGGQAVTGCGASLLGLECSRTSGPA